MTQVCNTFWEALHKSFEASTVKEGVSVPQYRIISVGDAIRISDNAMILRNVDEKWFRVELIDAQDLTFFQVTNITFFVREFSGYMEVGTKANISEHAFTKKTIRIRSIEEMTNS